MNGTDGTNEQIGDNDLVFDINDQDFILNDQSFIAENDWVDSDRNDQGLIVNDQVFIVNDQGFIYYTCITVVYENCILITSSLMILDRYKVNCK